MKNNLVLKIGIDWIGTTVAFVMVLFVFYIFKIWNWQTLINNNQIYGLVGLLSIMYLYGQHRTTVYYLYEDKLIVKFPFRPFYNKFEFILKDIETILFYNVNTLSFYSFVVIKCKSKKRKKYHLAYTNISEKMLHMLNILESKGIKVDIKSISGYGELPK